MSTAKPTYAAVAAKNSDQGEAPPPYTAPNQGPSGASQPLIPHQTILPPQPIHASHAEAGTNGWTPPPNASVARSRALRRFWVAFFWAWVIWIVLGLIVGGGISDVSGNPPGRRGHWDRDGRWHDEYERTTSRNWHHKATPTLLQPLTVETEASVLSAVAH